MDAERAAIVDHLSLPETKEFALRSDIKYQIKNAEKSIKARRKGNEIYIKKKHVDEDHKTILYNYNKSIAYAPSDSEELMYAYSNRAYFLMHVNKYNEALDSLDKAIQLTDSTKMKLKLYCHKVKCLAALGSSKKDDLLKEIDQLFKKSKISIEDTILMSNIITQTKSAVASMKKFKDNNQQFLQEKEKRNKIINDREKVDPFDFVEIKSTEKMGRGLYAKTDFKTGDIVLVEKPCLIQPNFSNQYVFCSHCLAVAWTGIPCETCHDYMFCSLKCKSEAWQEYHHIECSITPYLILYEPEIIKWIHMSLKFVISLMKDNITISELKSKLNISRINQAAIANVEPEQKIILFNKLMDLSHHLPKIPNNISTLYTVKTLIFLVKYTSFFPEKLKNMQYDHFSKNEDFIFIGSLLLRMVKINAVNTHGITDVPAVNSSQLNLLGERDIRGYCTGLISSMTNHSCAPNIRRCFTDDMKYVFYALEPITSGTQLLDSYHACFYECSASMRRRHLHTNFVCKCIACEQNWPCLLAPGVDEEFLLHKQQYDPITHGIEMKFINKIYPLTEKLPGEKIFFHKDLIKTLTDMMNEVAHVLPQPSFARSSLLHIVDNTLRRYWGLTVPFENFCGM